MALFKKARVISPDFRCYPDVLEWVIQKRADERRGRKADVLESTKNGLDGLVKAELYTYQKEGVLFAFRTGRALLADEIGLGKTIQAIATAELYKKEMGINCVYIICPTSLKYQWRAEIEKFSGSSVTVIEGSIIKRREQYEKNDSFYKILAYNVVARDYVYLKIHVENEAIIQNAVKLLGGLLSKLG